MNKLNTLIIVAFLAGCVTYAPFDYSHNQTTNAGIDIRLEKDATPLSHQNLDEYYRVVSQCVMGETPDPFFLIVISNTTVYDEYGRFADGIIDYAPRMPIITFQVVEGGEAYALAVFTHEVVHALLWLQGKSTLHSMPEFERCSFL